MALDRKGVRRNLTIIAIVSGVVWLTATAVLLFYIADLAPIQALLTAFVAMDSAFGLLFGSYLVTNTRRAFYDPYADTTEALLLRPPPHIGDERRVKVGTAKDRTLTERISDMVEQEAAARLLSSITPPWVASIRHDDADATFTEGKE